MKKYKKGELAKVILLLSVGAVAVASVCVAPGLAIIFKELNARNTKERYRVQRALKLMQTQGLLMRQIKNGQEVLMVTERGQAKAWSILQDDMKIQPTKKWDGLWRIAMFDIPEVKSRVRKEVSFKIKDLGMVAIQDSVFVSPFPCKKEIDSITEHYDVKKFFIYIEATTIELEEDLIRKFNLKR